MQPPWQLVAPTVMDPQQGEGGTLFLRNRAWTRREPKNGKKDWRHNELKERNFPWAWRPDPLRTEAFQAFPFGPKKERYSMGLPIVGGLISSVVGILTGTVFGIAPQLGALLRGLGLPV